ncbi:MAG: hypothetical protein V4654_12310 [Bdellovibrionota bacterium]
MKKNEVSISTYPSDKNLFDLIVSEKIAKTKLQRFLRTKGIFCKTDNLSELASMITMLILDESDIREIVSFTSVRENRFKTTAYQFASDSTLEEIVENLMGLRLSTKPEEFKIRTDLDKLEVNLDKSDDEITCKFEFHKTDFNKNIFLQKENHELIYKVKKTGEGIFEINLRTTSDDAAVFTDQINSSIKKLKTNSHIHEVLFDQISESKVDQFFNELLKSNSHSLRFDGATNVKMQRFSEQNSASTKEKGFDTSESYLYEEDVDVVSYNQPDTENAPVMRSFAVSGVDILKHSDVQVLRKKGFFIRSVTGIFLIANSSSTTLKMQVLLEFNNYGKFQTEIKKSILVYDQEKGRNEKHLLLPRQKEEYLSSINRAALEIFDLVRQNKTTVTKKQNNKDVGSAALKAMKKITKKKKK